VIGLPRAGVTARASNHEKGSWWIKR